MCAETWSNFQCSSCVTSKASTKAVWRCLSIALECNQFKSRREETRCVPRGCAKSCHLHSFKCFEGTILQVGDCRIEDKIKKRWKELKKKWSSARHHGNLRVPPQRPYEPLIIITKGPSLLYTAVAAVMPTKAFVLQQESRQCIFGDVCHMMALACFKHYAKGQGTKLDPVTFSILFGIGIFPLL